MEPTYEQLQQQLLQMQPPPSSKGRYAPAMIAAGGADTIARLLGGESNLAGGVAEGISEFRKRGVQETELGIDLLTEKLKELRAFHKFQLEGEETVARTAKVKQDIEFDAADRPLKKRKLELDERKAQQDYDLAVYERPFKERKLSLEEQKLVLDKAQAELQKKIAEQRLAQDKETFPIEVSNLKRTGTKLQQDIDFEAELQPDRKKKGAADAEKASAEAEFIRDKIRLDMAEVAQRIAASEATTAKTNKELEYFDSDKMDESEYKRAQTRETHSRADELDLKNIKTVKDEDLDRQIKELSVRKQQAEIEQQLAANVKAADVAVRQEQALSLARQDWENEQDPQMKEFKGRNYQLMLTGNSIHNSSPEKITQDIWSSPAMQSITLGGKLRYDDLAPETRKRVEQKYQIQIDPTISPVKKVATQIKLDALLTRSISDGQQLILDPAKAEDFVKYTVTQTAPLVKQLLTQGDEQAAEELDEIVSDIFDELPPEMKSTYWRTKGLVPLMKDVYHKDNLITYDKYDSFDSSKITRTPRYAPTKEGAYNTTRRQILRELLEVASGQP